MRDSDAELWLKGQKEFDQIWLFEDKNTDIESYFLKFRPQSDEKDDFHQGRY